MTILRVCSCTVLGSRPSNELLPHIFKRILVQNEFNPTEDLLRVFVAQIVGKSIAIDIVGSHFPPDATISMQHHVHKVLPPLGCDLHVGVDNSFLCHPVSAGVHPSCQHVSWLIKSRKSIFPNRRTLWKLCRNLRESSSVWIEHDSASTPVPGPYVHVPPYSVPILNLIPRRRTIIPPNELISIHRWTFWECQPTSPFTLPLFLRIVLPPPIVPSHCACVCLPPCTEISIPCHLTWECHHVS